MTIKCPNCAHSRSILEGKVPPTAEYAKCPKCGHRFRFRTLEKNRTPLEETQKPAPPPPTTAQLREEHGDIWDAVESLQNKWQNQLKKNVTEVLTPQPVAQSSVAENPNTIEPSHNFEVPPEVDVPQVNETLFAQPTQARYMADNADTEPNLGTEQQKEYFAEQSALSEDLDNAEIDQDEQPLQEFRPAHATKPWQRHSISPEEKVEQSLTLLVAKKNRRVRDLGQLSEYATGAGSGLDEALALQELGKIHTPQMRLVQEFLLFTKKALVFSPEAFAKLEYHGSMLPALLFCNIQAYFAILSTIIWQGSIRSILGFLPYQEPLSTSTILLLTPVLLSLGIVFLAGVFRIFLGFLSKKSVSLALLVKMLSYSTAPFVLSFIPIAGLPLATIWSGITFSIACKARLNLSPLPKLLLSLLWLGTLAALCLALVASFGLGTLTPPAGGE